MIEINHQQARYMIRQGSDGRRLPDEQWAVLQAHLEGCADCRAYREGLDQVAHTLRRALHDRWNPVHGPAENLASRILNQRLGRKQARRNGLYAGLAFICIAFLFSLNWLRQEWSAQPESKAQITAVSPVTPPTPSLHQYRGVLAYEDWTGDNGEIFLLNLAGGFERKEQINLTSNPANETSPSWSPDGAWLAFLSDRSGKPEVYVMHVAGSRLTRLTSDPGVFWQGPISWSRDGRYLALTATQRDNGASWVYLVPLDGSGARSLGLTRGASGLVKFSPSLPLLAYGTQNASIGGLNAFRTDSSWYYQLTYQDNNQRGMRTGYANSFDWSPDGYRLLYLAEGSYDLQTGQPVGEQRVQVNMTGDLPINSESFFSPQNLLIESQPGAGSIHGASWVPGEDGRVIAYLKAEEGLDCWQVHLRSPGDSARTPLVLEGLCIEGGISQSSWSPDSQWVVLIGRESGQQLPGYYALRVPRSLTAPFTPVFERLMDLPVPDNRTLPALYEPQVRPEGRDLTIQPKAGPAAEQLLPPSSPTLETPGRIVYQVLDHDQRGLFSRQPGDTTSDALDAQDQDRTCPAVSPDGSQIAFLAMTNASTGTREIFRMEASGGSPVQVTAPVFPYDGRQMGGAEYALPQYGCPVWSPDGLSLAATVLTSRGNYIMLVDLTDGKMHYVLVPQLSMRAAPVWSPDGQGILLASFSDDRRRPQIIRVDAAELLANRLQYQVLAYATDWDDVTAMVYAPDGSSIAFLAVTFQAAGRETVLKLITVEAQNGSVLDQWQTTTDARLFFDSNALAWLPDGHVGLVVTYDVDALVKSEVFLYQPQQGAVSLFRSGDVIFDSAWSADGQWVVLAAESGLWALDVNASLQGRAGPVLLDSCRVYAVDWR